jgi:replicative DNA helicase
VSVAEIAPRGEGFDRTPPHDVTAEMCVLGGMLLSKDAISDVMETIRPDDHYRPAHQMVHEAILELYGRGEPVDAITIADLLEKRGELSRAGGRDYLHTLIATVPTAANAGYYARIVRERAILRRLVEVGTRIVQLGYSGDGDADALVDRAQAEVYGVTERRVSEDYLSLSEIMPAALDEIEAIGSRGGGMAGVPTGFADLDALTNGLHPGQMIVIAARPAVGKALALDTPLPTPDGWTTMGDIRPGDRLLGADGRPVTVVAATEVLHGRPCYEVEFSDGEIVVADGQHQWVTWDVKTCKSYDYHRAPGTPSYPDDWASWMSSRASRHRYSPDERAQMRGLRAAGMSSAQVATILGRTVGAIEQQWNRPQDLADNHVTVRPRTTEEIASSLRVRGQRNHAIPAAKALHLPEADLALEPYVLGYLLGDGDTTGRGRVACDPRDRAWLMDEFTVLGHTVTECADPGHFYVKGIRGTWRSLGLAEGKRVPAAYMRGSFLQRLALVQGLVDSDGSVDHHGSYRFCNTNKRLVDDFVELVSSLGCVAQVKYRVPRMRAGRPSRDSWEVIVPSGLPLARLPRKELAARHDWGREQAGRYIVDVRPVPSVPVRCVQVDGGDHLYLAGRSMIPTHNSTLALDLARAATIKHQLPTVIFSLEMSRNEITMRLLSAEARVPLHSMRTGQMSEEDWTRLARRMSEVVDAPLYIDDSPNMSMMEIRAKCRRLKQRNDLRMVIVDYLQLMSSPKRTENRQQEVSEMSRSLKLLAKEIDVPVIAISQLNRGPEQRTDKRPMISDLRESGCLTADTRILRADNGAETTLGELVASGEREVPVWSLDERLRLIPRVMTHAFPSGVKEVFRVRLRSGREVQATANHPFLSYDGWHPLGSLRPGDRVAVPRHTPGPIDLRPMADHQLSTLARRLRGNAPYESVPVAVFAAPRAQVASFVRHLWGAGGTVRWDGHTSQPLIQYTSASRRLVDDVARLLLRFNVLAEITELAEGHAPPRYQLSIGRAEDQRRFIEQIDASGGWDPKAVSIRQQLQGEPEAASVSTIPAEIWDRLREALDAGIPTGAVRASDHGSTGGGARGTRTQRPPTPGALGRVATILDDADLEMIATNDVFWDEIASVQSLGEQTVYDATVPGTHNFVANGISLHNSIEQDADMVVLLHREDAYERESPRAGEADMIVAKHRNGPTATVTVAFQGHYSRFVDMAPG